MSKPAFDLNHNTHADLNSELETSQLTDHDAEMFFEHFDDGLYIGMMSGTSLDGLDAVLCRFTDDIRAPLHIVATYSQAFPPRLREVLLALCQPNGVQTLNPTADEPNNEIDWFGWASRAYGEFASSVVNSLLQQADTSPDDVLAIGCHGQTIRHRPEWGFSLQLVDANIIAERTGISVVHDFRRRDMAVGGQGAPLVPAFHAALFSHATDARVLLNLGGIANITVLPALNNAQTVVGYDTGPANLLLDAWTMRHLQQSFDADGQWAASGQVIAPLLKQLLTHPFFAKDYPKSTGREDFHLAWLDESLEQFANSVDATDHTPADVQATLAELSAIAAADQIARFNNTQAAQVYVCGGGALNTHLLNRLRAHLPEWTISTTQDLGLDPLWVEAAAFAWLARQTLMSETGNLPAVTGADKKVVLGQVCF